MSGILNVLIASIGAAPSPVGLLAAIRNPTNTNLEGPRIAIKNDQLNLVVNANDGTPEIRKLITTRLGLDLSFVWQRSLNNDVNFPYGSNITIDSAGNVIVVGYMRNALSSANTPYLVKFNSSGTLQWQRRLEAPSVVFNGVAVDSSNDIYAVGTSTQSTSRDDVIVAKYSASGTNQYQRIVGDTRSLFNELAYSVAVPSSTLIAIAGENLPANVDGALWFLNQSNGTSAFASSQRDAGGSGTQQGLCVIKGETDDVCYYALRSYATLSTASKCVQVLMKWTLTGGFVWQRFFEDTASSSSSLFVSTMSLVMSPDNTAFYVVASTGNRIQLSKWGIDGSLVWQRRIEAPTAQLYDPSITVDSLDNIYVSFSCFAASLVGTRAMVLKVPGSGAGSGNSAVLEGVEYDYITSTVVAYTSALLISNLNSPNSESGNLEVTPTPTNLAGALTLVNTPF
jgi:hypothetical protein